MEGVRTNFYTSFYAGTKTIFLDGVSFYRAMYRDTTSELLKVASTWKKYNSFQIFKSKSHEKWNEHGNHYSNKFFFFFFFFYVFSMLIFKPALNVPLLDSKFSNIQIIFKSHRKMEGVSFEILLLLFLLCFFLCWY